MATSFLDSLIAAQQESAIRAVTACAVAHAGKNSCSDFFRDYWYGNEYGHFGTHDRDLPWAAHQVITSECLTPQARRELAVSAWTGPEFPEANLSRAKWLQIFARTGFLTDRDGLVRPKASVTLWRGAIPSRKAGMAWTSDRDRASWFARRLSGVSTKEDGEVWRLTVEPGRVLARFVERGEEEFVVDTRRLLPERDGGSAAGP